MLRVQPHAQTHSWVPFALLADDSPELVLLESRMRSHSQHTAEQTAALRLLTAKVKIGLLLIAKKAVLLISAHIKKGKKKIYLLIDKDADI